MLAGIVDERADVVVSVAASLVERGVRAGEIVKAAAAVLGGGGGGRDTLARAGGGEVGRISEALDAARAAIEARPRRLTRRCVSSRSTTAARAAASRSAIRARPW